MDTFESKTINLPYERPYEIEYVYSWTMINGMSDSLKCMKCLIDFFDEMNGSYFSKCGGSPWWYSEIPELIPTYFAAVYGLSDDALFSSLFLSSTRRSSLSDWKGIGTEEEPARIINYRMKCGWPTPNGVSIRYSFSLSPKCCGGGIEGSSKASIASALIETIIACAETSIIGHAPKKFIESLDHYDGVRNFFLEAVELFPECSIFINRLELFINGLKATRKTTR